MIRRWLDPDHPIGEIEPCYAPHMPGNPGTRYNPPDEGSDDDEPPEERTEQDES